jgi:uncharacterized protein YkwD
MPMPTAGMGTAPPVGTMNISSCPMPPADASADAISALNAVNTLRLATGAGCMQLMAALDSSAQNHCKYNETNRSNAMCMPDGHDEVMSCTGFTGADVSAREKAAGYPVDQGVTEVLTTGGNPMEAVVSWVETLWHRIPVLDPWTSEMGWGSASGCDIIDFGRGKALAATSLVTVYPYDGQTAVPLSFDGRYESPMPPAPSTGWPSSAMINVYAQGIKVTEHTLTKDGDPTPLDHTWIDKDSSTIDAGYRGYLFSTSFIYGNKPFLANTKYRVKVVGTHTGGALNLEWSFTTGAAKAFGP